MKQLYFLLLIWLVSCQTDTDNVATSEVVAPKKTTLNQEEGYEINPHTGDTIQPILNAKGDTIVTGKEIPLTGKFVDFESVGYPTTVKGRAPEVVEDKIIKKSRLIPSRKHFLGIEALQRKQIEEDHHAYRPVNEIGDTIPLNKKISSQGTPVVLKTSPPIKTQLPKFKDDHILSVKFMDKQTGLGRDYVSSLFVNNDGKIYIGENGLSIYDGSYLTNYGRSNGLANAVVQDIFKDSKGNFWLSEYYGGLDKYDGKSITNFNAQNGMVNSTVNCVFEDSKGTIWIGTEGGLSQYDGEHFIHYSMKNGLTNQSVNDILEDEDGNLWIALYNGGVDIFDGKSFRNIGLEQGLSSMYVWDLLLDDQQNIWIATAEGLNKIAGDTLEVYLPGSGIAGYSFNCLAKDENGLVWTGSYLEGVSVIHGESVINYNKSHGLPSNNIRALSSGIAGEMWIGTDFGLAVLHDERFTNYGEEQGLSAKNVWDITADAQGKLYFATLGGDYGGVSIFDGRQMSQLTIDQGLITNPSLALAFDLKSRLWIGHWGQGIDIYNEGEIVHIDSKNGLCDDVVWSIKNDGKGNMWAGTSAGLATINEQGITNYLSADGMSSDIVSSIYFGQNNKVWIGTHLGGIVCMDTVKKTMISYTEKEGLPENSIIDLLQDEEGNLWFGTYGHGLGMFDGNQFTIYTTDQGLASNQCRGLIFDQQNRLWISHAGGISVMTEESENYQFTAFGYEDGLKGLEFLPNSIWIDAKNQMWIGGEKGVVNFDLNTFKISDSPPAVEVDQVYINQEFYDFKNLRQSDSLGFEFTNVPPFKNYPENLKLDYENNHLTFYISTVDWYGKHKVRLSYRLIGFDDKWSKPTTDNKIDFQKIPFGEYTLQVRAKGESGSWSDPIEYKFEIYPPWYQTLWAKLFYLLIAVGFVYLVVRLRTGHLKKRQKVLEFQIAEATEEIVKQKDEIEIQHEEIMDSIAYAKRIQSAILPPDRMVHELLPNAFVLYMPKDVVAGDFYWLAEIPASENKGLTEIGRKVLFAAADCTGHGVPGAMVSVVCNHALNRTVREYGITDPGKLLTKTRELVIQEFEKSEEEVKDGMDIALCSLSIGSNSSSAKLQYAGANNPLWVTRKNADEIEEIKANKQPIGKFDEPEPFTTHHVDLHEGDTIYIFSDGFADQFGGEKGKKFKAANFKSLLLSIKDMPMAEQKIIVRQAFEDWKGNLEQLDDICVIGVRV